MPREDYQTKGRRYVAEGRLTVTRLDRRERVITATCKGAGEVYQLGHRRGSWWCSCPARTTCAHLHALQLVATSDGATSDSKGGSTSDVQ